MRPIASILINYVETYAPQFIRHNRFFLGSVIGLKQFWVRKKNFWYGPNNFGPGELQVHHQIFRLSMALIMVPLI